MYRPEGWEEVVRALLEKMPQSNSTEGILFGTACLEMGADAILEGLRSESLYEIDGGGLSVLHGLIEVEFGKKGQIVFIPEEPDA